MQPTTKKFSQQRGGGTAGGARPRPGAVAAGRRARGRPRPPRTALARRVPTRLQGLARRRRRPPPPARRPALALAGRHHHLLRQAHLLGVLLPPHAAEGPLAISGKFEYLLTVDAWAEPIDHCNGLLLLRDESPVMTCEYVVNPATGWAAPLPPCPSRCLATDGDYYNSYLVFDPSVSMHYEVFSIPRLSLLEQSEWPPSTFIVRVFSSVSQRWEERSFSREGEPSGPTAIFRSFSERIGAVYWRSRITLYTLLN